MNLHSKKVRKVRMKILLLRVRRLYGRHSFKLSETVFDCGDGPGNVFLKTDWPGSIQLIGGILYRIDARILGKDS
ncbi:hypothetical protein IQA64_08535 [Leptospira borgpetersenii serovar Tarassovi]|nr:hypothetical protein [Leptospira borgpetersenii serovar Balcanica]MBE8399663.1 hypothetical protein [Leptospira borgpetersenii serovar Tarassovi]MBE8367267.1 hypothetical protein [Leptospira borgpetersenii serovar Balcanica]MBE8402997.1 hypothetical protein [Leptospira borgpetersenii serovar Tarassovi]MBE8406701.1 hypothetical protein [Leptospira borgpetersenii serovar Tarassovi]